MALNSPCNCVVAYVITAAQLVEQPLVQKSVASSNNATATLQSGAFLPTVSVVYTGG